MRQYTSRLLKDQNMQSGILSDKWCGKTDMVGEKHDSENPLS